MRVAKLQFAIMRRVIVTRTDKARQYNTAQRGWRRRQVAGFIRREPFAGARRNSILHNFIAKAFAAEFYDMRRTSRGQMADHIHVITTITGGAYDCSQRLSFALQSSDHRGADHGRC